ncbi:MAG: DUF1573 domain-containing protein [Candidatus Adiutrix sp.]|jgi:hypothetical protein|nr:DUF1573 domain-containing protein [Candidatus Adiutrix sp.]
MTYALKSAALCLGLLILCGLGGGLALAQQPAAAVVPASETSGPTPQFVIEQYAHDGGEVNPATLFTHTFTFKNEGDAPLLITRVLTGCDCLVAKVDREVAPGAAGQVTVSIRVYREWAGQEINKAAWLYTNDPLNPQVRLLMSAKVKGSPSADAMPPASDSAEK